MPVTLERGADGKPVEIEVNIGGEPVQAQIWRVQVGRVPLYLLDTNMKENTAGHREITTTLYGGDRDMRIRQEILLGVGGVRALKALGIEPDRLPHERRAFRVPDPRAHPRPDGHPGALLRARRGSWSGPSTVFTTHTPVPAGNELFDPDLLRKYLEPEARALGLPWDEFLAHGAGSTQPRGGTSA